MLHSVLQQDDINRRIINDDSFEISSEFFESLIQYLLSGGYEFISLDELYERIRMKKKKILREKSLYVSHLMTDIEIII